MASESPPNLDLSHLNEEERLAIEAVLHKDEEFRQEIDYRCRATKEKIYKLRKISTAGSSSSGASTCARCQIQLGMLFNRGGVCAECHETICGRCQHKNEYGNSPAWFCSYCMLKKKAKLQAGEWFFGANSNAMNFSSDTLKRSIQRQQDDGEKDRKKMSAVASGRTTNYQSPGQPHKRKKGKKEATSLLALADQDTTPAMAKYDRKRKHRSDIPTDTAVGCEAKSNSLMDGRGKNQQPSPDPSALPIAHGFQTEKVLSEKTSVEPRVEVSLSDELQVAEGSQKFQQMQAASVACPPAIRSKAEKPDEIKPLSHAEEKSNSPPNIRRGSELSRSEPFSRRQRREQRQSGFLQPTSGPNEGRNVEQVAAVPENSTADIAEAIPEDKKLTEAKADTSSGATADDTVPFRGRRRSGAVLKSSNVMASSQVNESYTSTKYTVSRLNEQSNIMSGQQACTDTDPQPSEQLASGGFRRRGRVMKKRHDDDQGEGEKIHSSKTLDKGSASSEMTARQRARQIAVERAKQRRQQEAAKSLNEPMPTAVTAYTDDGWEVVDQQRQPEDTGQPSLSALGSLKTTPELTRGRLPSTVRPQLISMCQDSDDMDPDFISDGYLGDPESPLSSPLQKKFNEMDALETKDLAVPKLIETPAAEAPPSQRQGTDHTDSVSIKDVAHFQEAQERKPNLKSDESSEDDSNFDVDSYFTKSQNKSASLSRPRERTGTFGGQRFSPEPIDEMRPRAASLSLAHRLSGRMKRSGSTESVYSISAVSPDLVVQGTINFHLSYQSGSLRIHITSCENIAKPKQSSLPHVYVKSYLLPDRSKLSKKKTSSHKPSASPTFNEELVYKIDEAQLKRRTLSLGVWDSNKLGFNTFLGGIRLELASADLTGKNYCLPLSAQAHSDSLTTTESPQEMGKINVVLRLSPQMDKKQKGTVPCVLEVLLKSAIGLSAADPDNLADPFAKCCLLPDTTLNKKTAVFKNTLQPCWEETLRFDNLTLEDMQHRVLELSVWDYDKVTSNEFMGAVRIGLVTSRVPTSMGTQEAKWRDCTVDESKAWLQVMQQPNQWVDLWLTLRAISAR